VDIWLSYLIIHHIQLSISIIRFFSENIQNWSMQGACSIGGAFRCGAWIGGGLVTPAPAKLCTNKRHHWRLGGREEFIML